MARQKVEFKNAAGETLAGLLETPPEQTSISRYALFAHCFTCGKDIAAASRLSRALAARGIAVLRFDFTGLGGSDGDFANSNFSSNIADLVAAANWLAEHYQSPQLLIGHSLGGAAVLSVAQQLDSVRAIVTIGAPATAQHVEHLFKQESDTIAAEGEALVDIGGRQFHIKKQMLEDISTYNSTEQIASLKKALLIFHSPIDSVVSIDQAAQIYQAAKHPKSFISLDKADHLLSNTADAEYVATTMAAWAGRYLGLDAVEQPRNLVEKPPLKHGEVLVTELDRKFLRGLYSDSHRLMADEPLKYGGSNLGPTPYDLLLMSLGSCTSMTLRMYANRKKLDLQDVEVTLEHERVHAEDCEDCDRNIEQLVRRIKLIGNLSDDERRRLLEIADKCPVHKTLEACPRIVTELVE